MISLSDYARHKSLSIADAIADAIQTGHGINKHADPTEGERVGLTADEARDIAREDVSLLYVVYMAA